MTGGATLSRRRTVLPIAALLTGIVCGLRSTGAGETGASSPPVEPLTSIASILSLPVAEFERQRPEIGRAHV